MAKGATIYNINHSIGGGGGLARVRDVREGELWKMGNARSGDSILGWGEAGSRKNIEDEPFTSC